MARAAAIPLITEGGDPRRPQARCLGLEKILLTAALTGTTGMLVLDSRIEPTTACPVYRRTPEPCQERAQY